MSMNDEKKPILPEHFVVSKIHLIRDQKVMIDEDLAELYGVETKRLNEQVKRNRESFSGRFYVPTHKEGVRELEVAKCDLKSGEAAEYHHMLLQSMGS